MVLNLKQMMLVINGEKIGLGVSNPTSRLDVSGNVSISNLLKTNTIEAIPETINDWDESSKLKYTLFKNDFTMFETGFLMDNKYKNDTLFNH